MFTSPPYNDSGTTESDKKHKKCGKPLTLFEGWTCLECERAEQEPILDKIRDEIKAEMDDIASGCVAKYSYDEGYYSGLSWVLRKIDKYKGDKE